MIQAAFLDAFSHYMNVCSESQMAFREFGLISVRNHDNSQRISQMG